MSPLLLAAVAVAAPPAAERSAAALFDAMLDSWKGVRTLRYSMRKVERLRTGEVVEEGIEVKLQTRPMRLYVAAVLPRRGQEIIYDTTVDPESFVVHPGRFPDITMHLDLRGDLATDRQHHLLSHSGFEYLLVGLESERAIRDFTITGRGRLFGREVIHLQLAARETAPRVVVAKEGESLWAFAERVGLDAYCIYYANRSIDDLTDELEARGYVVPITYGARTELAVDAEHLLPLQVVVFDHDGHEYERLEFRDLEVNPPLEARAFDPENPEYDF